MKVIERKLSRDLDNIEIHTFADTHIGDAHCDMKLLQKRIDDVLSKPNIYVILNGDLINNATKTSVSDSYAEKLTPDEQIDKAVELFKPLKERILAVTKGNHENRTYRTEGVDVTKRMCIEMGIPELYCSTACMLFLRFGTIKGQKETKGSGLPRMVCYSIYMLHGSRGGRSSGSKVNALTQMSSIIDADIYIHSHTHLPAVVKEGYNRTDLRNSKVMHVDQLFVNTGSILQYGGYAVSAEYKPSSQATPIIKLSGTEKKYTAEV